MKPTLQATVREGSRSYPTNAHSPWPVAHGLPTLYDRNFGNRRGEWAFLSV